MSAIAYSYIRFSSEPQAWGDSRRRQIGMAGRYAAKHGLFLDRALTFKDLGVSAFRSRNLRTGALRAFLDAVEQGIIRRGSYLLVESFDRLSRDQILMAQGLFLQIIQAGIVIVTLLDDRVYSADSINTNPYELLISLVAMMRANEESAYKSIRLKKAWVAKRARARVTPLTSLCPAWLWLDQSAGKFIVCESRAETVRRIFKEALNGKGREAIAKMLNRDRVPVMSGGDFSSSHWQSGAVARILKSPAVIGTLIPHTLEYLDGKRVYKALPPIAGYYPAIVDSDQFSRVQRLRTERRARQQSWSASRRQGNTFAWLARCPLCKASMRLIVCTQPHWRYLVCSRAFLHAGCKRRCVRYSELEDAFVDAIDDIIEACPWPRPTSAATACDMRRIDNRIRALRIDRAELVRTAARVHGRESRPMRQLKRIDEEMDALIQERTALRVAEPSLAHLNLESQLNALHLAACNFDMDRTRLNAILRTVFTSIDVDYIRHVLRLAWRHGGKTVVHLNPDVMSIKGG